MKYKGTHLRLPLIGLAQARLLLALLRQASYWLCSGRPLIGFIKLIGHYCNISILGIRKKLVSKSHNRMVRCDEYLAMYDENTNVNRISQSGGFRSNGTENRKWSILASLDGPFSGFTWH